ncbi:MAG: hypothetical protein JJ896_02010 [Rhodothermales bacterium]|nr:hypothetical protein [Rhodothermales bacterium]MBO6778403.1 hypothetical protein [Rhodothermales bacterium]
MIRVLFIILAVVSMALAFVLSISWLYLASAAMLVAAAVILTLDTRKRLRRTAVAGSRAAPGVSRPTEDLQSLGIMEIRPKATGNAARPAVDGASVAAEVSVLPPVSEMRGGDGAASDSKDAETQATAESAGSQPVAVAPPPPTEPAPRVGVVRKRARTARIMVEGVADQSRSEVVLSTFRALRAAVDATTIALLREEQSPLGYSLEAIVSRNSFARSGGRFTVAKPLATSRATLQPQVFACTGPKGFNARRLGYYHEPIAIHTVAFVPLAGSGASWLLVADSMSDNAFDSEESQRMLREFGRLIQALVGESASETTQRSSEVDEDLRPRREIIAEEMQAARDSAQPLSLALVHLNRGEGLNEAEVSSSESALSSRLAMATSDGRVERFGELTFGVLQTRAVDDIVRWASDLHVDFRSSSALGGAVSIGVAMLDPRHDSPDALRADATAALRESYETGECVILE